MMPTRDDEPLQKFFYRLTERTLSELGLFDSDIANYLAGVLSDFAHADKLYSLKSENGGRVDRITDMLTQWPDETALLTQRAMRRYVGDYALFMSGLFRTHVEQRGSLDLYLKTGRMSYQKVSELDLALYRTGFLMFQELSNKFEYYSGALDYMRKAHFALAPKESPVAGFLKRVEHLVRSGLSSN